MLDPWLQCGRLAVGVSPQAEWDINAHGVENNFFYSVFSSRIWFIITPWLHVVAEIVFKNACRPLTNGNAMKAYGVYLKQCLGWRKPQRVKAPQAVLSEFEAIPSLILWKGLYMEGIKPLLRCHTACLIGQLTRFKCRGSREKLKTCLSRSCQLSLVSIVP